MFRIQVKMHERCLLRERTLLCYLGASLLGNLIADINNDNLIY